MGIDIGLLIAATTAIVSVSGWYRSQVRASFSHEQEYKRLIHSQMQCASDHQKISEGLNDIGDRLSRLEILLIKGDRHA